MIKHLLIFYILSSIASSAFASKLDTQLIESMHQFHVPVVGYAIINNGHMTLANTISIDKNIHVSNNTLFQAASISKPFTTMAALMLTQHNDLLLQQPANHYLTSWKIPQNPFNKKHPVLIKYIMDMTSGLSVHGFTGYPRNKPMPTPIQLLNGTPPSNTPAVQVFYRPGTKYFYSGGSFQVLQQVITDVTHQPFINHMNKDILKPLDMKNSIFGYPLVNKTFLSRAVPGYLKGKTLNMVPGGWHNYAGTGSGGLWSTPSDIAKFAMNISNSYLGKNGGMLTPAMAQQMLKKRKHTTFGLGVHLGGNKQNLYFSKAGDNLGYKCYMIMFPKLGKGLIIMTNSDNARLLIYHFIALVAKQYHWPRVGKFEWY